MQVIAVLNQKGGSGKTTIATHLARAPDSAAAGRRLGPAHPHRNSPRSIPVRCRAGERGRARCLGSWKTNGAEGEMKASLKDSRGPGKAIFHDAAIWMVTGQGYNRPSDTPPQGPMSVDTNWFTEFYEPGGSAFGLKIKAKLHDEQSAYQHIEIYDTETFGHLMVIDGCVMLTQRDNFLYHEMMAHPALFNHAAPRRVVVIGGGDCGTLREVLRHEGVQQALQVEIDERVTRLSERYFPELCEANGDPRAQLLFEDGIAWFANAPEASVDVVIVDS